MMYQKLKVIFSCSLMLLTMVMMETPMNIEQYVIVDDDEDDDDDDDDDEDRHQIMSSNRHPTPDSMTKNIICQF